MLAMEVPSPCHNDTWVEVLRSSVLSLHGQNLPNSPVGIVTYPNCGNPHLGRALRNFDFGDSNTYNFDFAVHGIWEDWQHSKYFYCGWQRFTSNC